MDLKGTINFFTVHFAPEHVQSYCDFFGFQLHFRVVEDIWSIDFGRVAAAVAEIFTMFGLGEIFPGHWRMAC